MAFAVEDAKEVLLLKCQVTMTKKCRFNVFYHIFSCQTLFNVTRKEGKKKGRRSNMKKIPKTTFFGHILKKSANLLFGIWSLLLVHIQFAPS
jgi:hypothetical protein